MTKSFDFLTDQAARQKLARRLGMLGIVIGMIAIGLLLYVAASRQI